MEWASEHWIEIADGKRGFYALRWRAHLRRWRVWFYAPGRTGVPIGEAADIEDAQRIARDYDAPRKRGRKAKVIDDRA